MDAFWELPGPILRSWLGNAPELPSRGFLGPFCDLGLAQNGLELPFVAICGVCILWGQVLSRHYDKAN